ncbi:hypothetical protein DERP_006999, partial [Dermatophagoides pteronyssinus]
NENHHFVYLQSSMISPLSFREYNYENSKVYDDDDDDIELLVCNEYSSSSFCIFDRFFKNRPRIGHCNSIN